jgi:hypothetical protein
MFFNLTRKSFFIFILILAKELMADSLCQPSVEVKAGYFFYTDNKMRSVFNDGGWDIQLSSSIPVWEGLQLYTSVEYIQTDGQSLGSHQKTRIWQVPVTIGLKSLFQLTDTVNYYFTIGPRYFYLNMRNHSSFVPSNIHNDNIGGFFGTGFTYSPCDNFFIDLFGEYSYEKIRLHPGIPNVYSRRLQVGGLVFGGGLGYTFYRA